MKIKQLLLPAFAAAVGISFVAAEVKAAQENMSFTGRARGWYVSSSTKANDDADTISNTQFKGDSRLGAQGSTTKGDWTGSAKAEIDSAGFSKRDMWAQIGNKSFDARLGRMYFGDACVTASYPVGVGGSDCIGGALGRSEGVKITLKGLPVGLDVSYMDVDSGADDKTGFRGHASFSAMNASFHLTYTSVNTSENGDRSDDGSSDGDSSSNSPSILVTIPVGKLTLSGAYENTSTSTDDGSGDVDTGKNKLILAANIGFGGDMSLGAFYNSTRTTSDDIDDEVTNTLTVGFKKQFPGTKLTVGYHNSNTSADETASNDGASETSFAVGMQYGF